MQQQEVEIGGVGLGLGFFTCLGFFPSLFSYLVSLSSPITVPVIFSSHSFYFSPLTLCPHISGSISNHLSTFLSSQYTQSNLYQNILLLPLCSAPRGLAAGMHFAIILSQACPRSPFNASLNDLIFQNRGLVRTRAADQKFPSPSALHSLCHASLSAFP